MSARLLFAAAVIVALTAFAPAPFLKRERGKPFVPPQTIEDLVQMSRDGGDLRRGAPFIKQKYEELDELAKAYKPRRKGGLGVGPAANNDGVQTKLVVLSCRPLTEAALANQKDDIASAAHIILAVNEVTRLFEVESRPAINRGRDDWLRCADQTSEGARELLRAARASDAKAVQAAAGKVLDGCSDCHAYFRD